MDKRATIPSLILFVIAAILAGTVTVLGSRYHSATGSQALLIAGLACWMLVCLGGGLAIQVFAHGRRTSHGIQELNSLVAERMEQFSVMLNLISEQQLLSERAKSIVFRDKDRDALDRAIREEIARGQYDAALLLVNDMEVAFGYRGEAEQLRQEIAQLRDASVRRAASDVIVQIDRACASEKWDEATELAQRLCSAYPNHELCRGLPDQIRQRKEAHKQELLQRWRDAVARKDIDGSVEVLRQLDLYVTPEEVVQLKDGALEIFKARIERLRETFKDKVHQKRWGEAIQVGEDIVTEFPTSKLAQEVRDMMDMLQHRAADERTPATAGTEA